jgi:hypothetical protein
MSRADSILQTASMARCVSVAVTATNQIAFALRCKTTAGQRPRLRRTGDGKIDSPVGAGPAGSVTLAKARMARQNSLHFWKEAG